jgi:hypothetical protein
MSFNMGLSKPIGFGREFCPCKDEYCLDGCYFCAARLKTNEHWHVTGHLEHCKDKVFCCCEGHYRLVADKPNFENEAVRVFVID